MFRYQSIIHVMLLLVLFLAACEEKEAMPPVANPEITGSLVSAEGCKSTATRGMDEQNTGCLRYSYDTVTQRLSLTHVNAGFNCCPEVINADISVQDAVIRIVESQVGPNCRCNCLFDLDMVVENLPMGAYTIVVEEPLLDGRDPKLEFAIDLSKQTEGDFCAPRNFYPWRM
jgi:hypothetical protein